jgi:CRISP-associated protein Cas1
MGVHVESISASDLKNILHPKRADLYYLEHCRVLVNGGRVEYVTDAGNRAHLAGVPEARP